MHQLRQHIIFRISTIFLALILLLPAAINFVHNIEHNHQFELCDNPHDVHLHKLEKECDFCKFKVSQDYHNIAINYKIVKSVISTECFYTLYSYQYNYQHVSFSLRAPPSLV